MTAQEQELWRKIQEFKLEEPTDSFPFTQRLARENGWTFQFADRVVEEYRKFLFLCCISAEGVTPSDAVDQAWHLHLTYTHSYWVDLCQNTLHKNLHHHPTKGGQSEEGKFRHYYSSTKELYLATFGEEPPLQIWPHPEQRFSDTNFRRVNLSTNWVFSKPTMPSKRTRLLLVISVFILGGVYMEGGTFPFLLFGIPFVAMIWIMYFSRRSYKRRNWSLTAAIGGASLMEGDSGCSGCSDSGCSGCSGCGGD